MSNYKTGPLVGLFDPTTNAPVGFIGLDGKEYFTATSAAFGFPGNVAITGGSINATVIGNVTPSNAKFGELKATYVDSSATPGNVTNNSARGRAAFAVGASNVTVTNNMVAATSTVLVVLETSDATLTQILRVTPGAGSFIVTGNAIATAATTFSFQVIN